MSRIIPILLIVGIFVNLIKGGELILRPHQQKWLQDKFDTLTLYLDYTQPLKWLGESKSARKSIITFYGTILLLLIESLGIYWLFHPSPGRPGFDRVISVIVIIVMPFFFWSVYKFGQAELRKSKSIFPVNRLIDAVEMESNIRNWILNSNYPPVWLFKSFLTLLMTIICGLAVWFFFWIGTKLFIWLQTEKSFLLIIIALLLLTRVMLFVDSILLPIMLVYLSISILNCMVFLLSIFLIPFEILVRLLRSIAWRITEYNKGAFAAIILIVTVILGVAEVYVRIKSLPPPSAPPVTTPAQTSQPSSP
jgi:hypothetical protein